MSGEQVRHEASRQARSGLRALREQMGGGQGAVGERAVADGDGDTGRHVGRWQRR